jgi:hypothetical protein
MPKSSKYWYIILRQNDYVIVSFDHEAAESDIIPEWKVNDKVVIYGPWKRRPSDRTAQQYFDNE